LMMARRSKSRIVISRQIWSLNNFKNSWLTNFVFCSFDLKFILRGCPLLVCFQHLEQRGDPWLVSIRFSISVTTLRLSHTCTFESQEATFNLIN
jgi:hypothetical protein